MGQEFDPQREILIFGTFFGRTESSYPDQKNKALNEHGPRPFGALQKIKDAWIYIHTQNEKNVKHEKMETPHKSETNTTKHT